MKSRLQILEFARELSPSLDLDSNLNKIAGLVLELLESKGSSIYLLESDKQFLKPAVSNDPPFDAQVMSQKVNVESSLSGKVVKTKKGMIFNNASQDPDAYQIPGTSEDEDEHLMVLPLMVGKECLGTLNIYRRTMVYSYDDLELAQTFALYASSAIRNSQIHQDFIHEIKERKQAENALQQSHQLLETAEHIAKIGSWEWELATNKVNYSTNALQLYGIAPEEYDGNLESIFSVIHPDDVKTVQKNIKEMLVEKKSRRFEYRIVKPDDTIRTIEGNNQIKFNHQGEITKLIGHIQDITERKETEEALRKKTHELCERVKELRCLYDISTLANKPDIPLNKVYQGTVEVIPPGWHYPDITGARIVINDQEYRTKNYSKSKWMQSSDIHAYDKKIGKVEVIYLEERPIIDEGPFLIEERDLIDTIARKMGSITERKQTEIELHQSENILRGVINNAPNCVYVKDREGKYILVNKAMADNHNTTVEELTGRIDVSVAKHWFKTKQSVDTFRASERAVIDTRQSLYIPAQEFTYQDGKTRWFQTTKLPITIANNSECILCVAVDITDQVKIQEELSASEKKFKNIFENSHDVVFITRSDGTVMDLNEAGLNLFGYTKKDINKINSKDLYVSIEDRQKILRQLEAKGFVKDYEVQLKKKDGTVIDVITTNTKQKLNGSNDFIINGILRDVSEQVRLRNNLENSLEKLKKADQLKTNFIANISHEIRTPLNAIMGFTDLIHSKISDMISPELNGYFGIVEESGARLMSTVHSLLDISQIEVGTIQLNNETLNMADLVTNLVKEQFPDAQSKAITLNFNNNEKNPYIIADRYCVEQALSNLLDNAIKYTEQGAVTLKLKRYKKHLYVTIIDTGIGMSTEFLSRLYKPFEQESVGYNKRYQGVGLGLTLVKKYMDLVDAKIEVSSTKNVGTNFTLKFNVKMN